MSRTFAVVLALLSIILFPGARRRAVGPRQPDLPTPAVLQPHRSFAVTDHAILDGFSFERVMMALVSRSGTRTTALGLYQQWFDTQNPKPGLDATTPHCDDFTLNGRPAFNGFPRTCPTNEGVLARTNPFPAAEYVPLALINRFDMASPNGANCGQYRMIFARRGANKADRLHLIFEAVLPNPTPWSGIAGCRPVAQFWADLSAVDSISERRARLEQFFFTGLAGFAPVIAPEHYTGPSGGGIRSFQNTTSFGTIAKMFQFRLEKRCELTNDCRLLAVPDTLEDLVPGSFFDARRTDATAVRFREAFLRQIPNLAARSVNGFFIDTPAEFQVVETEPEGEEFSILYHAAFNQSLGSPEGVQFQRQIEDALRSAGSSITPSEVIRRAHVQTCFGCHTGGDPVGDGIAFPRSHTLEHVTEDRVENGEAGQRFAVSPAMRDVFIPNRMEILRKFLASGTPPVHSN